MGSPVRPAPACNPNFWASLSNWWTEQGWDPTSIKDVEIAIAAWHEAYAAHVAARRAAEAAIRPVVAQVQVMPEVDNAVRARFGISLRDATRTPAPVPTTAPTALVTSAARLTHTLRLVDESTPTRRARPKGVGRAELFVALTLAGQPAPADPSAYRYIGSVKRGETTLSFESDKGGMQAHYLSRWVSTSGAAGPWSNTASATVAA